LKINNYQEMEKIKTVHGVSIKQMYESSHAVINHILLKSGESLKPHVTPVDAIFYILEGNPTVMVGNEKRLVTKDDMIESPENVPHCLFNESSGLARILVIKLPKPKEKSRIL